MIITDSIALLARAKWDDDKDMSVGKLLMALAGMVPGYRSDTDAIHALLATHDPAMLTERSK